MIVPYPRGKKKDWDKEDNYRNTPRFRENTGAIIAAYFFSGVNSLIFGLSGRGASVVLSRVSVQIGVIMLVMIPVTCLDKRRGMRGGFAAVCACVMHLALCLGIAAASTFWWMAVYGIEAVLILVVVLIVRQR